MKKILILIAFVSGIALASCSKMNDLHNPYLEKGEKVYAAKVDSVEAFIGVNSQILNIYVPSQRVAKGVVKWNLGTDSVEFIIPTPVPEYIPVRIESLEEGNYTYEIYTYDSYGNISIPFEITSNVISEDNYDNMIEVACKSFYYSEFDKVAGGPIKIGPEAKIKDAQNFNGEPWFKWDCAPLPGATVKLEYLDRSDNWQIHVFKGENVGGSDWVTVLHGKAQVEPKDQVIFYYWTEYPGKSVSHEIATTIDLGEEYAEDIRYYEYIDSIDIEVEGKIYDKIADNW